MKTILRTLFLTGVVVSVSCSFFTDRDLRNRLEGSPSAYLRSAARQPVFWQEWNEDAFETAQKMDRLILLDIGAVWCHWCHVMDRESYENEELAAYINENFIAVKVDRDEHPDVDSRFQKFIQLLSGRGGWPLTCILTPDGNVIYGGTYFPPEDRNGRPGLKTVLSLALELYSEDPENVKKNALEIVSYVKKSENENTLPGAYDESIVQSIVRDIENRFDAENGGFGSAPKFPNGSAIELALAMYDRTGNTFLLEIAENTLQAMANGGIRDHIGGGFHRYAIDNMWQVPHFEKMTMVNAELLMNYLHIYQLTGDAIYREVIDGILEYYDRDMTDRDNGGFYAHQDADISLEDDGSYFTWTMEEIRETLSVEEFSVIAMHYALSDAPGEIRESPDRNVISAVESIRSIANKFNKPVVDVEQIIGAAKKKLKTRRKARPAPFIDTTLFTAHNSVMISAYAEAYKTLGRSELKEFALKTLDLIIEELYTDGGGFAHSFNEFGTIELKLLEDQVWMTHALLDGFELSGDIRYLDRARDAMIYVIENFQDPAGGFWDIPNDNTSNSIFAITQKPVNDVPVASPNSAAIRALDRLYILTDDPGFREASVKALTAFAGNIEEAGLYASSYGLALLYHLYPPAQVVIIGDRSNSDTEKLFKTAANHYRPGKEIYIYDPGVISADRIPETVRLKMTGGYADGPPVAFVCIGTACAPPTSDPGQLQNLMATFGR